MVAEEMLAAVAGITATSPDGSPAHLELLLLPFNTRAHTPISLTGLLAPFGDATQRARRFQTDLVALSRPSAATLRAARAAQARDRARPDGL